MLKLSLRKKLISMLIIFLGLLTTIGILGLTSLKKVTHNYEYLINNTLHKTEKIDLMFASVHQIRADLYKLGFNFSDVNDRTELIKKIEENIAKYDSLNEECKNLPFVEGEKELYETTSASWEKLKNETIEMLKMASPQKNDIDNYFPKALSLGSFVDAYTAAQKPWMELQLNEKIKWEAQAQAQAQSSTLISTSIVIACVIFGIILGYFFSNSLANQLFHITESVTVAGRKLSSASTQLLTASETLSSASQKQASSLEETSASLTEISGMAESNVHAAEFTENVAKEVFIISEETRKSMDNLAATMGSILESNTRIEKLVKVIEQVAEKTQVIDDIVFKTQLLSFNASVEAERAGEHGRGFAVVAQEVGNLAQLSGKAALEISAIVKNSIKEAESVASENKSRVTAGGKLTQETKEKMGKVLQKMNEILENISKIVQASREQGQGINQISSSVESISHLTQETAGTAEDTSKSSSDLANQAKSLMALVVQLKTLVDGVKPIAEDLMIASDIGSGPKEENKMFSQKSSYLKIVSNENSSDTPITTGSVSDDWEKL